MKMEISKVFPKLRTVLLALVLTCVWSALTVSGDKVLVVDLSAKWTLRNENGSIQINVPQLPSGVYSAVRSLYGNVLHDENDVDLRWIAHENWTYTRRFELDLVPNNVRALNVTLYGIDTIATVRLNDQVMGKTDNMFVEYSFSIDPKLHLKQQNTIEIELMSPLKAAQQYADALLEDNNVLPPYCQDVDKRNECYRQMLRKMQLSFGTEQTLAAPSLGIWRRVVLESYEVAVLRDVDVAARCNDTHWELNMRLHLTTDLQEDFKANVTFLAAGLLGAPVIVSQDVSFVAPMIRLIVAVPKNSVELWWPNGYGSQKLYPLSFIVNTWVNTDGPNLKDRSISDKFLKFGFRTIELVEDEDDYGRSFYFKVNGKPIFVKGANYLPSDILPENSYNEDTTASLLKSAKDAHMNMIRVWGGGLYESDVFYNYADRYGLLVWQDMTFTEASYPITEDFVQSVSIETVQNARRLAYHPSLAFIVTNDEIELYLTRNKTQLGYDSVRLEEEYKQLFRGTIKYELNTISRNSFDPRPGPMISTPSRGIQESIKDIGLLSQDPRYGDIHYQEEEKDLWDPDVYPRARFISEIGFQSLPDLVSWNRTLSVFTNDSLAAAIKHRQHSTKQSEPMLKLIKRHLPVPNNWQWEHNIDAFIYMSQLAQAQAAKTATELFRSQRAGNRTMGVLYWHLNDVWVAPTASLIDFYGNYKLIYYWAKQFLAPLAISALYDAGNRAINVTLVQDDVSDLTDGQLYEVTINTYLWSDLYPKKTILRQVAMNSLEVQQIFVPLDNVLSSDFNETNCFLEFLLGSTVDTTGEKIIHASTFFYFPGSLKNAVGIQYPSLTFDLAWCYCTGNQISTSSSNKISYNLKIRINSPAVFVFIEVSHPDIKNYTLSDNGFTQVQPLKIVHLEYESKTGCFYIGPNNVKVTTMNSYMLHVEDESTGGAESTTSTTKATTTTRMSSEQTTPSTTTPTITSTTISTTTSTTTLTTTSTTTTSERTPTTTSASTSTTTPLTTTTASTQSPPTSPQQ